MYSIMENGCKVNYSKYFCQQRDVSNAQYIHDIFRTMNLNRVLDIVESRNDALGKLKKRT